MSKSLHDNDRDSNDVKAIAIPRVFYETAELKMCYPTGESFKQRIIS